MKLLSTQTWGFLVIVRGMLPITLGITSDLDWNFQDSTLVFFFFFFNYNLIGCVPWLLLGSYYPSFHADWPVGLCLNFVLSEDHLPSGTFSDLMAGTTIVSFFHLYCTHFCYKQKSLVFAEKKKLEVIESGFENFGFSNCSCVFLNNTYSLGEKSKDSP